MIRADVDNTLTFTHIALCAVGATAAEAVAAKLDSQRYDLVVVGAGIRVIPSYLTLFERLVNVFADMKEV